MNYKNEEILNLASSFWFEKERKKLFSEIYSKMIEENEINQPFIINKECNFIKNLKLKIYNIEYGEKKNSEPKGIVRFNSKEKIYEIRINKKYFDLDYYYYRSILSHEIGHVFIYNKEKELGMNIDHSFRIINTPYDIECEKFASEIGRHILLPDNYLNELKDIEKSNIILNICKDFLISPIDFALRFIVDYIDYKKKKHAWENCFIIIDNNLINKNVIIGEIPIKETFTTINDKINIIYSKNDSFKISTSKLDHYKITIIENKE